MRALCFLIAFVFFFTFHPRRFRMWECVYIRIFLCVWLRVASCCSPCVLCEVTLFGRKQCFDFQNKMLPARGFVPYCPFRLPQTYKIIKAVKHGYPLSIYRYPLQVYKLCLNAKYDSLSKRSSVYLFRLH